MNNYTLFCLLEAPVIWGVMLPNLLIDFGHKVTVIDNLITGSSWVGA